MCLKTYKKASDPSELSSERIVERLGTYLRQYHHREEDWNTQSSNIINVIQNKLTKDDLLNIDDKEFQHKGIISQYVLKAAKELNGKLPKFLSDCN
jgi:membrane carboxypeptidase/penicillin-binding protein PbpC